MAADELHVIGTSALLRALGGDSRIARLAALLRLRPALHRFADVEEYLWGDELGGGPDNTRLNIRVMIWKLRHAASTDGRPCRVRPPLPVAVRKTVGLMLDARGG